MQRIFRGVLRFSSGGFTNLRIARKFSASAPSSTSAQTGRLTSLWGLFSVPAMTLPKNLVYAIQPPRADSHFGCRENDNPHMYCNQKALLFPSPRGHSLVIIGVGGRSLVVDEESGFDRRRDCVERDGRMGKVETIG